jgi:hypothetical protein
VRVTPLISRLFVFGSRSHPTPQSTSPRSLRPTLPARFLKNSQPGRLRRHARSKVQPPDLYPEEAASVDDKRRDDAEDDERSRGRTNKAPNPPSNNINIPKV